ncbi:MAG: type II toxin-antitoxin system HicB family antitoxin [Plesiomonas sp.]
MLYPIAVELGEASLGVRVPDLEGCFSAGDDFEDALKSAKEAIELHIEGMIEEGMPVPKASDISRWVKDDEYAGVVWAVVDVDVNALMGKSEKINVTLPSRLIQRIDGFVAAHGEEYKSRSEFLAQLAYERVIMSN